MKVNGIEFDINDTYFGDNSVSISFSQVFKNENEALKFLKQVLKPKIKIGQKIGQVLGQKSNIEDNLFEGIWGGYTLEIPELKEKFDTNHGIKGMNIPVFVKSKDGILSIYEKLS